MLRVLKTEERTTLNTEELFPLKLRVEVSLSQSLTCLDSHQSLVSLSL